MRPSLSRRHPTIDLRAVCLASSFVEKGSVVIVWRRLGSVDRYPHPSSSPGNCWHSHSWRIDLRLEGASVRFESFLCLGYLCCANPAANCREDRVDGSGRYVDPIREVFQKMVTHTVNLQKVMRIADGIE